jgi:hypothetical protein
MFKAPEQYLNELDGYIFSKPSVVMFADAKIKQ